MLPSKTLASMEEKSAPGYKKSKDRVTVMACSNVTGNHKLPVVVIGKSKKPRAFKKIKNKSALPVYYTNQKSAWMDSESFKVWFKSEFVPRVAKFLKSLNLPRKAILLLDNAPSHPDAATLRDGDITVLFLPPNVTSLCQPMDQGVLEATKKRYRYKLLESILLDDDVDVVQKLKKIDMRDVVHGIHEAWNEVKPAATLSRDRVVIRASNLFPFSSLSFSLFSHLSLRLRTS